MSLKLNNKGFTLPEIMVSLGLLGGISIVTVRLIENQANNEAHLKAKAEIMKTTSILKTILNDSEGCRNMMKDQVIPPGWMPGVKPAVEVRVPIGQPPAIAPAAAPPAGLYQRVRAGAGILAYKEILVPNAKYGLFRTGSIELAKTSDNESKTRILNPTIMDIDVDTIDLIIQFRLESKSIMNAFRSDNNNANDKTFLQRIPLLVTFNYDTNQVKDCGLVVSEANAAAKEKFCVSLGNIASWDDATQKCNFISNKCPAGFIPERQNSTSTLFTCVDIKDQFKADDLFDTNPAGCVAGAGGFTVVTDPGTGKLKINCN